MTPIVMRKKTGQNLSSVAVGLYQGTTYYLPDDPMPWLFPVMAIIGVALQLCAVATGKKYLLLAGLPFVLIAAAMEKDICLFTGDSILAICLWRLFSMK